MFDHALEFARVYLSHEVLHFDIVIILLIPFLKTLYILNEISIITFLGRKNPEMILCNEGKLTDQTDPILKAIKMKKSQRGRRALCCRHKLCSKCAVVPVKERYELESISHNEWNISLLFK